MVFITLERILVEDRLSKLPDALLDVLNEAKATVTRIRMS